MTITGSTRVFLILGDPVEQVRAPEMFNVLFRQHQIDAVLVPSRAHDQVLGDTVRMMEGTWDPDRDRDDERPIESAAEILRRVLPAEKQLEYVRWCPDPRRSWRCTLGPFSEASVMKRSHAFDASSWNVRMLNM